MIPQPTMMRRKAAIGLMIVAAAALLSYAWITTADSREVDAIVTSALQVTTASGATRDAELVGAGLWWP